MSNKVISSLLLFCLAITEQSYAQQTDENWSVFKLASTPFMSKAMIDAGFSYGVNHGSPSHIIQLWFIPNNRRSILFHNAVTKVSFVNRLELSAKFSKGASLAFNSSHIGVEQSFQKMEYGLKWKFLKSEELWPDMAIELNSHPLSLSLGSSEQRFKYFFCIDWAFDYFIYPYQYSLGVACEILNNVNLFIEGRYMIGYFAKIDNHSARAGVDLSLLDHIRIDVAAFYFGYKFSDAIPGRNGLTWQDPSHIITEPEKNGFLLLSTSIAVNLNMLKYFSR